MLSLATSVSSGLGGTLGLVVACEASLKHVTAKASRWVALERAPSDVLGMRKCYVICLCVEAHTWDSIKNTGQ